MVELLLVVLGCCLFFSWRGSKSLQTVTAGLDTLAQGSTVSLPAAGFAGELAQKLKMCIRDRVWVGWLWPPSPALITGILL